MSDSMAVPMPSAPLNPNSSGHASLLDLPAELILHLASFLASIYDLHYLSCTNKRLQRQLSAVIPNTILRLAVSSGSDFFWPITDAPCSAPYPLIAATARQLSDWANRSTQNAEELRTAFHGGIAPVQVQLWDSDDSSEPSEERKIEYAEPDVETVLDICVEHCGLTMEDIRHLHAYKRMTIDPVIDLLDKCSGQQWRDTPGYDEGAVSDPEDLDFDATETFYSLAIYGSLFAASFEAFLEPREEPNRDLDVEARLDYLKYCVPDDCCWMSQHRPTDAPRNAEGGLHEWLKVDNWPVYDILDKFTDKTMPQIVLRHLLRGSKWKKTWHAVRQSAGGDFDEQWKQKLWEAVVMFQGFEGMEMIGKSGPGRWKDRLMKWRAQIEELIAEPRMIMVGQSWSLKVFVPEYPSLKDDLHVCTYGYYDFADFA